MKTHGNKEDTTMKTFLKTTGWLVMAAALSFGISACSSDDAVAEQNVKPTGKYTMVVKATKGDADTRGLSLDGSTLGVKWYANEEVVVVQAQTNPSTNMLEDVVLGTLYAKASDDGETELSGTLNVAPVENQSIYFHLHSSTMNYHEQNGVLLATNFFTDTEKSIEKDFDYAKAFVTTDKFEISGTQVTVSGGITLLSEQAIVKFTLKDQSGNDLNVTNLTIQDKALNLTNGTSFISNSPIVVTPPSVTNVLYVAINGIYTADKHFNLNLTAIGADGYTYTYSKPYDATKPVVFEHGKYYTRTVKMTKTFKTFRVNDVINVGDKILLTDAWNINGGLTPGSNLFTLVRANISGTTVTEAADGDYYVLKYDAGDNYIFYYFNDENKTMPVTATSDGLVVTEVGQSGNYKTCTLAVHENAPSL